MKSPINEETIPLRKLFMDRSIEYKLKRKLRGLWFNYYIWVFNIVFIVGFMSYGIIMFRATSLFSSVILASGMSYLIGYTIHNATCGVLIKSIEELNKKIEKVK